MGRHSIWELLYRLGLSVDLGFAFDYNGSGTPDHLVFYSPGNQLSSITKVASDGTLSEVYSSNQGIGGYDLKVSVDLGFAFDYDGLGKLDHLLFYRPSGDDIVSGGSIFIMKNNRDGTFTNRYADRGIGGFDIIPLVIINFDFIDWWRQNIWEI